MWTRLFLILDPAIEFPFIFAFHPTTVTYRLRQNPRFPTNEQLLVQVAVFFAIELAFHNCVLRFIHIPTDVPDAPYRPTSVVEYRGKEELEDEVAESLVVDFLRPRGTLLLAVGLLGMPTALTRYTGQLHPMAMAGWVALQQLINWRSQIL